MKNLRIVTFFVLFEILTCIVIFYYLKKKSIKIDLSPEWKRDNSTLAGLIEDAELLPQRFPISSVVKKGKGTGSYSPFKVTLE